ncbi:hypothetical protein PU912_15000 [Acinetobacter baumannii]|uniref:DUF7940 domain-containing protein n=1 Tax=Acinetobacter baumannii TaxID=470 RepID=UPI0023674DF6|nr:hypothetical protein [Acinetobacter baumannii]MDD7976935.1 hypothetical protein [Acinetobacter baumannii]MDO8919250.1 hypothetical protein [Acinetobacter baumannii]
MSQWKRNFRRQLAKQNSVKNQLVVNESQSIQGVPVKLKKRWIVENWRSGWLWISNYVFGLIGYIAFFGLPPEVIALFPVDTQKEIIGILSGLGIFFRFLDQNRAKPLPPVDEEN